MYDEQRYQKPDIVKDIAMTIDGDNGVRYYLCFNNDEVSVIALFDGVNIFMASLDYVVVNGILHAMTDGKIVDHNIDYGAWSAFRRYSGECEPPKDKYMTWLES